jgi:TatD DNase family protein
MTISLIDAHIHLDKYPKESITNITKSLLSSNIDSVISVSMDLASSKDNLTLSQQFPQLVYVACGFHPEQLLPNEADQQELIAWLDRHISEMVAIGEIGLPYYTKMEAIQRGEMFEIAPYVTWLEELLRLAKIHDKPVVLHAVYEDADIVCDLLEAHDISKAHFHWFKGSSATLQRMAQRGYYISFTPDILYEEEIQEIALHYPIEQVMLETDGPWPFEGPFAGQMTHPSMIHESASFYAQLCHRPLHEVCEQIRLNTKKFYNL